MRTQILTLFAEFRPEIAYGLFAFAGVLMAYVAARLVLEWAERAAAAGPAGEVVVGPRDLDIAPPIEPEAVEPEPAPAAVEPDIADVPAAPPVDVLLLAADEDRSSMGMLALALEMNGLRTRELELDAPRLSDVIHAVDAATVVVASWTDSAALAMRFDPAFREAANRAAVLKKLAAARLSPDAPPMGFGDVVTADFTDWRGEPDAAVFQTFVAGLRLRAEAADEPPPPPVDFDVDA